MVSSVADTEKKPGFKIRNFRWWIAILLALATAVNYLDRQSLPIVISELRKFIPVNDAQYGLINSLFLLAYGTMYAVGGRIIDVLGTRRGYAVMIIWWSLANVMHGFVASVVGLGVARFLLGIGEGGGFPGSAKAVSEWFPKKERSFAFGIFNTGSSLGAVVAPPLIAGIVGWQDWRWAFFVTGALGLIWVIAWLRIYAVPSRNKYITTEEKTYIESEQAADGSSAAVKLPWLQLFRFKNVWALLLVKFLTDSGWFFFIFWLPKYLSDVRGLHIKEIGSYAIIPYAAAGLGSFIAGWISSYMLKKNFSIDAARKIPMGFAAALLPASLLITGSSLNMCLVFFSLAMFGHQFWSTLVQTLATDIFPSKVVGSVAGLMGAVGTYGAMLFSLIVGYLIQNSGYGPAFIIAGVLHPVSFILLLLMVRKIKMQQIDRSA